MNVDAVVSILANTLYSIERKRVSARKAFSYVCKRFGCGGAGVTREGLYTMVLDFVSKYYTLKHILERGGRTAASHKMMARVYLYMRLLESGEKVDFRLRKRVLRDLASRAATLEVEEPWARLSYPRWFYERLAALLSREEAEKLLEAMNRRVLWVRVNTLKVDLDRALRLLEEEGFVYEQLREAPFLLKIVRGPKPVRTLKLFREGALIPQDKASALVVLALKVEPQMLVYDFAAAPGIKTSLIMQLTDNRARVVALDLSLRRLTAMKRLLKLYGVDLSRVDLALADSRRVSLSRRADLALVDAVCSSSGAVSKDPSVKIFLKNEEVVSRMHRVQVEMLYNALQYADAVVYATCSLLPEEGEEVVEEVMDMGIEHKLVDVRVSASRGYRGYRVWNIVRRTYPHIDQCEGFFIARLER